MGDLNLCLLKQDQPTIVFCNMLYSLHFTPFITKPTRFSPVSNERPSLLDHIWINNFVPHKCGIIELDISDHLPTFVHFLLKNENSQKKVKIKFRLVNESTKIIFKNNIENFNWESVRVQDVDAYMDNFMNALNDIYCKSFPLKSKFISFNHYCNPWFTNNLKKLIEAKSKYFQLLRLNLVTVQENNLFRNKVTSLIRKEKFKYRKNLFLKCKGDLIKTWNLINLTLSKNIKSNKIKEILFNNVIYENDLDIANIFNNYFCSIGSDLDSLIPASSIDPLSYVNFNANSTFNLQPVSPNEVSHHINTLKNSKQNCNVFSVISLKDNSDYLSFMIADIINLCFRNGKFPNCLKYAVILALFKKGARNSISSYRPISLLPTLSKIFEKCIKSRLLEYLDENHIIDPNQFGFQKGLSTQDAIINLTERIYQNLNDHSSTLAVFIDFSKAFDTVNRSILLRKLERYGISGNALNLFTSYLDNRSQSVKVGNEISEIKSINIGLPQGSVLAPYLFLIYVNDVSSISNLFSTVLFADDTNLIFEDKNLNNLIEKTNLGLQNFYNWCSANRLSVNISKTGYMCFSNSTVQNVSHIFLNNTTIEKCSNQRILGVTIDDKLKFNLHINVISKKISQNSGILYKLRNYLDISTLRSIYYSFIDCYLNYCPLIFGNSFDAHLKPLEIAQKKCVRIIAMESPFAHTNPIFSRFCILKFRDIYKLNLGIYMYKNLNRLSTMISSHNYNTRSGNNSYNPMFQRLTQTQNQSIMFQAPNNWNNIPDVIKNATSLPSFKGRYKQFLLSNY